MKYRIVSGLIAFTFLAMLGIEQCKAPSPKEETALFEKNEFTGNLSCKSCHHQEHADWTKSHHFKAMLPANDSSVLGNFNNATLVADGVTSKFFKKNGLFYINTQGEDGKNHDFEIKYTFGFTPLQQYLVEFPGGRMQATRASWDTQKKKWFHQYAGQKIGADDWFHWTGNSQNWNTMCAACHSTNLQKGYDESSDTYKTTFNEVNVSCESCHGPGKLHIDYVKGKDYAAGIKINGSRLQLSGTSSQMEQINACGYCHARRADITGVVLPGKEFLNDDIVELPTTRFFYADGQMRDEDYNYTSFLQSKMFRRGVECSNCHNPHSGQLKLEGNIVCSQCHAPATYNVSSHTMHGASSIGNSCISCHMPSKLYMGNDLRHDHSFRVPRPDLTVKYGTPNTCNSCHSDKAASWAVEAIAKNFGQIKGSRFADHLVPGSRLDSGSESHLNQLISDTAAPNIIRAAAVDYISKLGSSNSISTLISKLKDSSAMVRFHALEGLSGADPAQWIRFAAPLLQDPVRGVRTAAAELFIALPQDRIPQEWLSGFYSAKAELERYISNQTDFAQGNVRAGDYYKKMNNLPAAEKYYKRALVKDSRLTIAKVNLASTFNEEGKNEEALEQLLGAQKLEPNSDHIYFSLGLLYAELKQPALAEKAFQKAIELKTNNIRVYYNYALMLQQDKKAAAAEAIFIKGLQKDPTNGDLLYALTILYLQQKNLSKANETAGNLKRYHGDNPNYQQLLQQLKM
ncbi:MAG: tetratricopeptide repeat protein [Chitinophagales bacterium]